MAYLTPERRSLFLPLAALSAALVIGLATIFHPYLGIAVVVLLLLGLGVGIWPSLATLAVTFILYTNAPAVAVKYHGLPSILSAVFFLLLLIPLINYVIFQRQNLIITSVLLLQIPYLLIQIAGALASKDVTLALPKLITYVTEGLLLYLLITNVVRTPETLRRIIWVLLLAGLFMGGLSFYQQVTQTLDNNYGGFAQNQDQTEIDLTPAPEDQPPLIRQAGPIGEKNRYSQIMLMLVPLGMFRFWGERSKKLQLLAAICTIFCLIGSALTFSRGGAVGLALMLVIMVAMRYIKPKQILVVVAALAVVLIMFPRYTERITSLQSLTAVLDSETTAGIQQADGAIQGRATEMLAAALVFIDHPLIGAGPGMFPHYVEEYSRQIGIRTLTTNREAHVLYLGIAAENGALGLACFMAILFITLRDLARGRRRWRHSRPDLANMNTSFMFVIIIYMTTGIFLHMSYMRYFWFMLALANMASYIAAHVTEDHLIEADQTDSHVDVGSSFPARQLKPT